MTAVADAASCNTTVLTDVLASTDVVACTSDTGYSFTPLAVPTDAEMALMCTSSACQAALAQLQESLPSECTMGTFSLYADLITLEADYCSAISSGSESSSDSPSSSASAASSTDSTASSSDGGSATSISPSTTTSGSSSSGDSGGGSTTAAPEASTASSATGTSSGTGVSGATAQPGGSASGSGSSSPGGLSSSAMAGIIAGAVALMLVLLAICVARRRRRHRRSSHEPSVELGSSPVGRKQVTLLEDDGECDDKKSSTTKTHSTGGSMEEGKSNLWEDPVIVAARISIDRIKLGRLIGRGGFGEVYRGQYRNQEVAVKTLLPEKRKDLVQIQTFLTEIRLAATMEHPCVVSFIGVAWESLSDLYCVTEFMAGGDLRSLLNDYHATGAPKGLDASKVEIAYQVAHALTYLHSLEPVVLHRDLKSRNILLTESLDAKITDFGASRVRSSETMTAGVGSWMWMAPEVMVGGHYDEKADVFSLGVVLSELDTHEMPYAHGKAGGFSDAAVMQKMSMGQLRVRFSRCMDPDTVRFAESCVSLDPRDRPSAAEALYYFQKARTFQY
jgi:tRNA A-37 threonylcarbamoyl transferase component Bud32